MLIETLKLLFARDLKKLRNEIEDYQQEENIWKVAGNVSNSAGNLCLHLIGNLNTYIGNEIGKTGYVRDRAAEFSLKDLPRAVLLAKIDEILVVVERSLDQLDESALTNEYPLLVLAERTSMGYFLVHLTTHLAYHLGQINYHRRLIDQP
jgi:uncharacterized damage-inducible protein DinB